MGELAESAFSVRYIYHHIKGEIPVHLVFERDTNISIVNVENCRYIHHCKQAQIDKNVIHKNFKIFGHDYIVGDQLSVPKTQHLNTKHRLKVCTKMYKHGKMVR